MGKKSRRSRGESGASVLAEEDSSNDEELRTTSSTAAAAAVQGEAAIPMLSYPSDGPTEVELLQTESSSLQAKLDQLTHLALANDRAGFVAQFVPLDLSRQDHEAYLQDLTTAPEADGQWANLASEVAAIAAGRGVDRIEGDQINQAIFYFQHPRLEKCDREVAFVCVNGEWRAEG